MTGWTIAMAGVFVAVGASAFAGLALFWALALRARVFSMSRELREERRALAVYRAMADQHLAAFVQTEGDN